MILNLTPFPHFGKGHHDPPLFLQGILVSSWHSLSNEKTCSEYFSSKVRLELLLISNAKTIYNQPNVLFIISNLNSWDSPVIGYPTSHYPICHTIADGIAFSQGQHIDRPLPFSPASQHTPPSPDLLLLPQRPTFHFTKGS